MKSSNDDRAISPIYQPALDALALGLCPIPPRMDGSKAPVGTWKQYQKAKPTEEQIRSWYACGTVTGYGLITGTESRNLELFEFDCRITYDEFKIAAAAAGLGDLIERIEAGYCETTPGAGVHWFYFCADIAGNTKLATRPKTPDEQRHAKDKTQVLIETRGEGGFVIIAPSYGKTHPSGKPYELQSGGLATIITITPDERRELHALARTFHVAPDSAIPRPATPADKGDGWKIRPGADFNDKADWRELLEAQGWSFVHRRGETDYWRRPGKDQGVSACTNWQGKAFFYCWSSSTEFEPEKPLDKFGFHARTIYNGDLKATAKALAQAGYGIPADDRKPTAGAKPTGPAPARTVKEPAGETALNPYRGTDDANADLLIELHGADIRFCPPWDKWILWTGNHWRIDDRLDIDRLAADVPKLIRSKAAGLTQQRQHLASQAAALMERINADGDQAELTDEHAKTRKAELALGNKSDWLFKLAGNLEGTGRRGSMLTATRHKVVIHHSELDQFPSLINASNGTVDLKNGQLRPHDRAHLLTHCLEIPYVPNAAAPRWLAFLHSTFGGDAELIQFVQRAVGYSLTGDVREQVLLICHGVGSNGKSVFLNLLRKLLGSLAIQAAPDLLMADKQRRHPTEQADLYGKRIIVCQETGEGRRFNETLVKQLTGGDGIRARRMHEDFWEFNPTHKLWISTNHKPEIRGTDYAIWRRIRLIPFNVTFTDDGEPRKNPAMERQLTAELPGILAWAVAGCLDWQRHGLQQPDAVKSATADYQAEQDVLATWLADCCVIEKRCEVKASELYASWRRWCEQRGEYVESQTKWGKRLTERGFLRDRKEDGFYYLGIKLNGLNSSEPQMAIFENSDFL